MHRRASLPFVFSTAAEAAPKDYTGGYTDKKFKKVYSSNKVEPVKEPKLEDGGGPTSGADKEAKKAAKALAAKKDAAKANAEALSASQQAKVEAARAARIASEEARAAADADRVAAYKAKFGSSGSSAYGFKSAPAAAPAPAPVASEA